MIAFRMHAPSRNVFDSSGALLYPGRWHTAGTRVVYAAEHASLATLETLIHAGGQKIPPRAISLLHIPDNLPVETVPWMELPDSQAYGNAWVQNRRSAILRIPSIAVNRMESNFMLNPAHPDFPSIHAEAPQEFVFNARFFGT